MQSSEVAKYRDKIKTKELPIPGVLLRFIPADVMEE